MSSTKTYGVGPAAEKANVGGLVNEETVLDAEGKTYVDGKLTFDPSADPIALIADDGEFPDAAK